MEADRWVTGIIGGAIVLSMLYFGLWHVLLVGVGCALVWEYFSITTSGWLRWVGLTYILAALFSLWHAPWVLLLLAWFNDTGAYFVGRACGGPKLAPSISPAKTWSGLLGGLLCGVTYVWGLSTWFSPMIIVPVWPLAVWLFLSISSHGGDLVESWMKRRLGIKDTGSYLPGHGGFLDRCDGVLGVGLGYGLLKCLDCLNLWKYVPISLLQ